MSDPASAPPPEGRIATRRDEHVLHIVVDRAAKRNAFGPEMIEGLARALDELEGDPELWVGAVYAEGDHFTAGLDLAATGPRFASGDPIVPAGSVNPWGTTGPVRQKPLVVGVQGVCYTLGIELILNADVAVAAEDARFSQLEVGRGILPFGGATVRFPQRCGWGNAMRWMLTGEEFGAAEALRMGLVQEVVPVGEQRGRCLEVARKIAAAAPLAVQATRANALKALAEGGAAAVAELLPELQRLSASDDATEGMMSFLERRPARFTGR